MNRLRFALLALLACALATAAGAADRRENRTVSGFTAISLGANVNLDVIQDGTESLMVEGDERILDILETFVKDGTLNIRYRHGTRTWSPTRVHAVVHARRVDGLALAATGDIRSPSISGDSLTVSVAGSGNVDIAQLAVKKAELAIGGSGDIAVSGRADELQASISGSGDLKASKLETRRAAVSIAGAGDATVWAIEQLAATISGAGTVRYYGDPGVVKSVRGMGDVRRVAAAP